MPTVQPRLLAQCSGLLETPRAKGPLGALPPAPQHLLVSGAVAFYLVTKKVRFDRTCNDCLFHSELHRPDIHRPDQPASLQCDQFQCRGSSCGSGGQQLQQLSDVRQQPGPGLQHRHKADLRPHESDSQVQPSSLLSVPCCCKAHLPGCFQPASKVIVKNNYLNYLSNEITREKYYTTRINSAFSG